MQTFLHDLRYAVRLLRKTRGFTLVAVIILAMGIASNTLVFSVVNAVLLHPLPYPDANRLVILHWQDQAGTSGGDITAPAFFMLKARAYSFESMAALLPFDAGVNLAGVGSPQYVKALRVSADFFPTLGVMPVIGRNFDAEEDQPHGPRVAILSYGLWKRDFDQGRTTLGHELRINGEAYIVIGVMPAAFRSYPEADVWLPLQLSLATADTGNNYRVIARLKNGLAEEQARRELESWSTEYVKSLPAPANAHKAALAIQKLQDSQTGTVRYSLTILFGAVVFVLLITCANLAALLLVRSLGRNHEIAIRAALGSSWARLLRIFLMESTLLALLGGTLGIVLAKETLPLILALAPADLPLSVPISINGRVALFTFAISVLTSFLFGLAPALRISQLGLNEMLKQASRGVSISAAQARAGRILVSVQTSLTLVLLTGATLLLQNFLSLQRVDPGFDPQHVLVAQVSFPAKLYFTTASTARALDQILDRLKKTHGVEASAAVYGLPLEKGLNLPIYPTDAPSKIDYGGEYRIVSTEYFQVLHIPLQAGRSFSDADDALSNPVAIVNQTLANRWWPKSSALGGHINVGQELGPQFADKPREVIGIVADIHEVGLDQPALPTVFIPIKQSPDKITASVNRFFLASIVVRTRSNVGVADEIRRAVASADPDLPLASLRPLADVVGLSLSRHRFYASLTSAFGVFALLLTAIGVYGLLSYQTRMRIREIGVRMAVGAKRSEVVLLVLRQGINLIAVGVSTGIVGAFFLRRLLQSMLYNLHDTNLNALASAALLLSAVATLASLLTALRAASIEPMVVLRNE
jgi:putative ABC transport system permease protein